MVALPAITDFTGNTRTEGQIKTFMTDVRAFLAGLLGTDGVPATALAALGGETADADILKADVADTLTKGFDAAEFNAGTKSTGTYTPAASDGNFQKAVNGGAHTLAPPTTTCSIVVQYTNNASAGTITTSGFTLVDGDTITTTNGNDFHFFITRNNGFSHLHVKALQ